MESGYITGDFRQDTTVLNKRLNLNTNFDILHRVFDIGDKKAILYAIDGFVKDDIVEKLMEFFFAMTTEDIEKDAYGLIKSGIPYIEADKESEYSKLITRILSGETCLIIEGYKDAIMIDCRTYPGRSSATPKKDRVLRGSEDAFVETLVFNTALIRRRIRDEDLVVRMENAGKTSKTDIAVCYMAERVDKGLLKNILNKIENIEDDALTMNQESLAENIYYRSWYNPFPKFKYTERPDIAAMAILRGKIVIIVDNAPYAMIIPAYLMDITEEADDFYFPPVTATYLRITRLITVILSFIVTPLFLLFMQNHAYIPHGLEFIIIKDTINIPIIVQLLFLEFAIDGLKLAAVNTPEMLGTPLNIIAALVIGDFSVNSGWFNAEVLLYMTFVALAGYVQTSYELTYAVKFLRIITIILTWAFNTIGFYAGIIIAVAALFFNRTISDKGYMYPLFPFDKNEVGKYFYRKRE